jgi:hypothetical protein
MHPGIQQYGCSNPRIILRRIQAGGAGTIAQAPQDNPVQARASFHEGADCRFDILTDRFETRAAPVASPIPR